MTQISVLSKNKKSNLDYYVEPLSLKNDYERLEKFIKSVEKMIRTDVRYSTYIAKLHEAGVMKCAILGNLNPSEIDIEMHHGPMFTLYQVVEIVVRSKIYNDVMMTTFSIADEVLTAHEKNMIQVVGLSKTPHKAWHLNKIFVHIKAAFGEVDKFIDEYRDGLTQSDIKKALRFIELCKEYEGSIDNDLFKSSQRMSFKRK